MIGKVVKMATVKHQPTFEILPSAAGGCLVLVIWPNGPEQPEKRDPHTVVRAQCPGCNHHVDPDTAGSGSVDPGSVDFAVADNKVAPVAGSEW
jgi:hypothetical protein